LWHWSLSKSSRAPGKGLQSSIKADYTLGVPS
jgi:hypothetical protein